MNDMKVCFIGVGSIAKRHIRNLRNICEEKGITLYIDAFRRKNEPADGVDRVLCDEDDMSLDYDAIFITNPTDQHLDTLKRFHNNGKHYFIEKPVVALSQIVEAKEFQLKNNAVYYVACPLRYNAVIQWVKKNVNPDEVISVRSISSSYLPDWRSGQDYRNTYSAYRCMGGGVSIDLIHEWDYLTYLFGTPQKVDTLIGKKSSLEIDSDDYAIYIAEYADKIVELHLDYFGRKTLREIELFTNNDTIIGNIADNKITFLCSGKTIDFHEERNDYQKRELLHFFDLIEGVIPQEDGYYHGLKVLELTKGNVE